MCAPTGCLHLRFILLLSSCWFPYFEGTSGCLWVGCVWTCMIMFVCVCVRARMHVCVYIACHNSILNSFYILNTLHAHFFFSSWTITRYSHVEKRSCVTRPCNDQRNYKPSHIRNDCLQYVIAAKCASTVMGIFSFSHTASVFWFTFVKQMMAHCNHVLFFICSCVS